MQSSEGKETEEDCEWYPQGKLEVACCISSQMSRQGCSHKAKTKLKIGGGRSPRRVAGQGGKGGGDTHFVKQLAFSPRIFSYTFLKFSFCTYIYQIGKLIF